MYVFVRHMGLEHAIVSKQFSLLTYAVSFFFLLLLFFEGSPKKRTDIVALLVVRNDVLWVCWKITAII